MGEEFDLLGIMGPGSSEPRWGSSPAPSVVVRAVRWCLPLESVRVRAVNDDFRSGRPGQEMKEGLNGTAGSGVMCDATSIQQTKLR